MKRIALLALLACLSGCGKSGGSGADGSKNAPSRPQPAREGLASLSGLPLSEVAIRILPLLAAEKGPQNSTEMAEYLGQNWIIQCEEICKIERK